MTTAAGKSVTADAPASARPNRRWLDVTLVVVLLAIAAMVQWKYAKPVPSFDELFLHIALTAGHGSPLGHYAPDVLYPRLDAMTTLADAAPAWQIWTHLDGVPHPPLYFLLLRLWRDVAGDSVAVARLFSMGWGLLALGFTFATARLVMDRIAATLIGLAVALSPTQAFLAVEIRPYAMMIGLGAVALYLMTRIEVRGPSRRLAIGLAAITLPLMLTHYFAAGICVAIAGFGAVRLRGFRRSFFAVLGAGAAIYLITWTPFFFAQLRDVGAANAFLQVDHRDPIGATLMLLCTPFRLIADRDYHVELRSLAGGVLFVLPWLLRRRMPALVPWCVWLCAALVPLAILDVAMSRAQLNLIRYAAAASPAVALLFVGCAAAIDRRAGYAIGVALVVTSGAYLISAPGVSVDCSNFAASAKLIANDAAPGEAVVAFHGGSPSFYGDLFALTCAAEPRLADHPMMILVLPSGAAKADLLQTLPDTFWLLAGPLDRTIEELLPGATVLSRRNADLDASVWHVRLREPYTPPP